MSMATAPMSSAYHDLVDLWSRVHRLSHLNAIASWDQAANMPPSGNEARAAAMAEMAVLLHGMLTAPELAEQHKAAEKEELNQQQSANLFEMKRHWLSDTALHPESVRRLQMATARCEHAWRTQRLANDWQGFSSNLKEVVTLSRHKAQALSQRLGVSPYEAMMGEFEPGLTTDKVDRVFNELRTWLPPLIQEVVAQQAPQTLILPRGPFPISKQRALCEAIMRLLGFDFQAGRLDISTHPFCGGVPEDVRLTTRFNEHEFITSLFGTIHETGHARYEQGRPKEWLGQPASQARSMAIHESQSLFFEMQLGCHAGFLSHIAPLMEQQFGAQAAFDPKNLAVLLTRVKPGFIRVDADEVTYPAHILLRYDIERRLIEGEIEADDIPALWDKAMNDLLGVDTRGNFKDGPMQDVHWAMGLFGYFPCYTLGAMYAAQWFASMRASLPKLDAHIAAGDLQPIFDWLKTRIWQQASFWPTETLTHMASGSDLNPIHFKNHLLQRYLGGSINQAHKHTHFTGAQL